MAAHRRRKFPNRGKGANPASENKQTDPAPIRAKAPLIEQYYVAVDRQLKSGYGTYEAAEKAAREIKKRFPNPALLCAVFISDFLPTDLHKAFQPI
jgi:hypothetical protein